MTDICLVTPRYPPTHAGGGEVSAQLLAEQLKRSEEIGNITVVSFDGKNTEIINDVKVARLADLPTYPYTIPNEIAYRRLIDYELECDVIHAYNMDLHPAVGRISERLQIPSVATLNSYSLMNRQAVNISPSIERKLYELTLLRAERPRLKRQMRKIDMFLPLSRPVKEKYQEWGLSDCEFEVIPNMIDPNFASSMKRTSSERGNLVYVGHLRPSKGVKYLVDAMNHLPTNYSLTVVGGGPEKEHLEARASSSSASERISFTGKIPYEKISQVFDDSDVFVHPGVWPEPFGTILEAMQSGLPVVATNTGGPSEIVPQPDLLCSPSDPSSLSKAIKYAYKNQDQIGQENIEYVKDCFHPDNILTDIIKIYSNISKKRAV
ncbi:glycosyltransferase family 1 protein [Halorubrum sp. SP3]|uniref:glycosyltransferase family 4 protein n=1 Tax=Halorubrum sp. SP3 TaxID=1537265 RepID=UPI0010F7C25F|nr:glycosyltransferase family 4 protein [Halorubrum sp. SP3]TKX52986.1 glycosyltransferase family 1 protein [Halorubrum sp. SP3]